MLLRFMIINGWYDSVIIGIFLKIYVVRFDVFVKLFEMRSFYLLWLSFCKIVLVIFLDIIVLFDEIFMVNG